MRRAETGYLVATTRGDWQCRAVVLATGACNIASVPQLAEAVVRVYREYKNGGVLITSKDGALNISTDKRMPPNLIVVQTEKGVNIYQGKDPSADDLLSPLKSILTSEK